MDAPLGPDDVVALNRLTLVARLLAGTVHDLNNALQIIGGSAESLARFEEMGEPARRAVDRIQGQATRAAAAIHELTQFARDRGDEAARVSLRDAVVKALAMRAYAMRRGNIAPAFDAAGSPAARVRATAGALQQIVLNLLLNAEQALQGKAGAAIRVELSEADGMAALSVADNGPGLDPAVADRAFEPFVTSRRVADATGLGLPAARILARRYGGDVTLAAAAAGGVQATLRLPLAG